MASTFTLFKSRKTLRVHNSFTESSKKVSKEIATKKTCPSCFVSDPSSGQEMVFDLNFDGRSTLKRK